MFKISSSCGNYTCYPDTSQHLVRHTNFGGSFSGNVGGNWCKRVLSQLVKGMRTTCPRDGRDPSRGSKNKKRLKDCPTQYCSFVPFHQRIPDKLQVQGTGMMWFQGNLHYNFKITVALAFMPERKTLKMQRSFLPEKIKKPMKTKEREIVQYSGFFCVIVGIFLKYQVFW